MRIFICLTLICYATSVFAEWEDAKSPLEAPRFKEFWDGLKSYNPELASRFNATTRITGGEIAERFQFPHQAGLHLHNGFGGSYLCGGSLISENYVLTAAHCLEGMQAVEVKLGAHELNNNDYVYKRSFSYTSMKIHEEYNSEFIRNDIALIKVSGVELIPGKVEIVKILPRHLESEDFVKSSARVSGWGKYGDNVGASPILRYTDLNIRELKVCSDIFGTQVVQDSNVCTTGEANKSTCGGDSGGPLLVSSGSTKYQIGVVSYGAAAGCELGYPSVFARIGSFADWIERNSDVKF